MSGDAPRQRLGRGSRLVVQDAHGVPYEVVVERVEEGSILVDASEAPVRPGESVLLEHRVAGDARYRTRAQIVEDGRAVRLHPLDRWERDNQRAFARVRTYGLEVTLTRPLDDLRDDETEPPSEPRDAKRFKLLDVSAGGAAIRAEPHFEIGEEVVCHFELPGECCFALPARVARVVARNPTSGRATLGVEFLGLDESDRAALLRWVYREQTRRRNTR